MMKNYVTYDEDGKLTGAFQQEVQPEHADCHIEVSDEVRLAWVRYRASEARDGVELLPPASPPRPAVPQEVTRRQARQALLLAGLLDDVEPALAAITNPTERRMAQIEWEDSQVFERNRPVLVQLAGALGLDDAQLDQLFIDAAGL